MKAPHLIPILSMNKPAKNGTIIFGIEYTVYSKLY